MPTLNWIGKEADALRDKGLMRINFADLTLLEITVCDFKKPRITRKELVANCDQFPDRRYLTVA